MKPIAKIDLATELNFEKPKDFFRTPFPEVLTKVFAYDQ